MLMHASDAETLNSIRLALGREEQQIRVNDSTSRETYDLTLSRSAPYASPLVSRTGTPPNANVPGHQSSGSTGHRILRLPQLVSKRGYGQSAAASSLVTAAPVANDDEPVANEKSAAVEPPSLTQQNSFTAPPRHHPMVGELPPSPPLEADYITGNKQPGLASSAFQAVRGSADQNGHPHDSASPAGHMVPPKVPVPRRAYTTNFGDFGGVGGGQNGNDGAPAHQPVFAEPSTIDPAAERTRRDGPSESRGGHGSRGVSDSSTASTAYRTASEDDSATNPPSPTATRHAGGKLGNGSPAAAPSIKLTHDSSPYLHRDGEAEAGPSSSSHRQASSNVAATGAVPVPASAAPPARQMPPRRNTTGSSLHTRRPASASSLSQRSGRSSREREALPGGMGGTSPWFVDAQQGLASPGGEGSSLALRTGDAAFDEEAAKHAEQLRRDRRAKEQKARAAAASGDSEGALAEKEATGLSALTRSRTGREARQRGDDHAHHHHNNDEPKVLVGNLIGEDHANYVLMYNMLTGIRIGVSRCQAKSKRALTDADYAAKHKFTFDIIGNELTPSAKYDFKFKDYAPWVFRELREYFHLDPADYLLSLTSKYILSELGSPGKSGSFFYFSRDYRFIIKTISHGEHKFLRRILRDYHEHIKANPHTLLSRFYGLHRVKLPHGRKIHFVIMNNLFPPHRDIHETYDLKGSSIGRDYPEEKVATKKGAVMKDLNWLRRNREIQLGPEKRALFEAQLKSDVALLQRLRIMDYSLLIGLHDMRRGNKENIRQDALRVFQPETKELRRQPTQVKRGPGGGEKDALALREAVRRSDPKALGAQQVTKLPDRDSSERRYFVFYQDEGGLRATDQDNNPTDMIYYLGVIDLFTPYTTFKRGEHFWKGLSQNKHMISAVPPKEYGQRFIDFLCSVITGGDKSRRPKMYGYTD
ncbi:related to phosphatidylinositol-4-phosphate 5-kinase [Pseudozyma flocculosa]|uniref:1-phosphatidylinositol-4-phosphate 5-kinase n=1 Tax=Pseudozyma flocculosa TaxID=84751 RepID=A0A5C3EW17_9BASI|nr:related to phosphatidylinositol-4-phosphate 5-kinase [Pseudozyma flocculosa]